MTWRVATVPETVPSEDEGGPGLSLLETWRRGTRVRVTLLSINGHVANRRRSMQAEVLNPARARTTGYRSVTSPQTNGPTFLGVASGTTPATVYGRISPAGAAAAQLSLARLPPLLLTRIPWNQHLTTGGPGPDDLSIAVGDLGHQLPEAIRRLS